MREGERGNWSGYGFGGERMEKKLEKVVETTIDAARKMGNDKIMDPYMHILA